MVNTNYILPMYGMHGVFSLAPKGNTALMGDFGFYQWASCLYTTRVSKPYN